VKAQSDIIVTSSSADAILSQIPKDQPIIFGPDRHLGGYLARRTGRDMLLWPGICIVHQAFSETELLKLKAEHPGAPVAAHPSARRTSSTMPTMWAARAPSSISR
jgi:quinolinate synthase